MVSLPHVSNGFVMETSQELSAIYRLNAFTSVDAKKNRTIPYSSSIDDYFRNRFSGSEFSYVANGRHGIYIALEAIGLHPNDCVTVLTTSANFYISSCVTKEIEKFCFWSREIEDNTKAIFVNHEFGYPYPDIIDLKKYGVPIIEDCCYAFNSKQGNYELGRVGDFAIYSFAKFFPVQFGGLIVSNTGYKICNECIDMDSENYLKSVLSYYERDIPLISNKRRDNHYLIANRLAPLKLEPRFELREGIVPGVFMFKAPVDVNLHDLKTSLWAKGIHCSVFYGEQSFFIPIHQGLGEDDFDYFYDCMNSFFHFNKS